jgi:regulator of sigma E protease
VSIGFAVIAFFAVIGPLILVHEAGHFVVAKLSGIHVEEFGIGFPPRLFTLFERGGTRYTLNAIPLGGFVRPVGEDDPLIEGGLASAPKRARFAVLAAGAGANVVAAYAILVVTFMLGWQEILPGATIEEIVPDSPAEMAGLEVGDVVLYANDAYVENRVVLIDEIQENIGEPVDLTVERGGEMVDLSVTPRTEWPEDQGPTGILVGTPVTFRPYGFFEALGGAAEELVLSARLFVEIPAIIIRENLPLRFLRPSSVVGISQLGGQAIEESLYVGQWFPILRLTSFVSLALAVTNLLPLPALDGGRIAFVLLEALRGRRVDPEREGMVHFVGLAVLLALMLIFVYLDLVDPLVVP